MATVRTPSGGLHLYYQPTPGQRNGSLPDRGLDWRAERGYVLAPPSAVHGKPYVYTSTRAERVPIDFNKIRDHFQTTQARRTRQPRDSTRDTSRWPTGSPGCSPATATPVCGGQRGGPPRQATKAPSTRSHVLRSPPVSANEKSTARSPPRCTPRLTPEPLSSGKPPDNQLSERTTRP
jgi:hypothetical protein